MEKNMAGGSGTKIKCCREGGSGPKNKTWQGGRANKNCSSHLRKNIDQRSSEKKGSEGLPPPLINVYNWSNMDPIGFCLWKLAPPPKWLMVVSLGVLRQKWKSEQEHVWNICYRSGKAMLGSVLRDWWNNGAIMIECIPENMLRC